jgi:hypothetical protein
LITAADYASTTSTHASTLLLLAPPLLTSVSAFPAHHLSHWQLGVLWKQMHSMMFNQFSLSGQRGGLVVVEIM